MDEKFVVCPFNKSHIISRLRIQYHIVKCKRSYPNNKKIVCPYDATEYIDPDNFMLHLTQCKKHRRLDVTEDCKKKQFELIQHGSLGEQPFHMPSHVKVTDEWDVDSNVSDGTDDGEISRDERYAYKIRRQSSAAVKKAYNFIPLVSHPIGRGQLSVVFQQYLNRCKPPLKPEDPNAPIKFERSDSNCDFSFNCGNTVVDGICNEEDDDENYCDAVEDENEKFDSSLCNSVSNSDGNNTIVSCKSEDIAKHNTVSTNTAKYYMPSVARGSGIISSVGRVMPIGRGLPSKVFNDISCLSGSFDSVLKQVVNKKLSAEIKNKEKNVATESFNNKKSCSFDKLHAERQKKFALTPSDLLITEPSSPCLSTENLLQDKSGNLLTSEHPFNDESLLNISQRNATCASETLEIGKNKSYSTESINISKEKLSCSDLKDFEVPHQDYFPRSSRGIGRGKILMLQNDN